MFKLLHTLLRSTATRRKPSPPAVRLRVEGLEEREVPANLLWDSSAVVPILGTATAVTNSPCLPTSFLYTTTGSTKVISSAVALAGYTNPCF